MTSPVKSIQWPGETISTIEVYGTLPSTNCFAKERIQSGCPSGTIIWALNQTAGKGRRGRIWQSTSSSLTFSILWVWPNQHNIGILPLMIGLGLVQELEAIVPEIKVKWPNDLWVGERKLGGILIENIKHKNSPWIIVGIGLNVNASPQFCIKDSTSLEEITQSFWCRLGILDRVLAGAERARILQNAKHKNLTSLFRTYGNFLDRPIKIIQGQNSWKARAKEVLADGRLLIEDINGQRALLPDEISLRF